jgi:hypothetical protein
MFKQGLLAIAAMVAFTGTAQAGQVRGQDPSSVVFALQNGGYKAILTKDSVGDPKIESASSGAKFFINFYGCKQNINCTTITLYSAWSKKDVSMSQMNDWNKAKRFSRAYIDKDGDPAMEFDVDLDDGGMSEALFIDNIQFWELSIANFKKHIGL